MQFEKVRIGMIGLKGGDGESLLLRANERLQELASLVLEEDRGDAAKLTITIDVKKKDSENLVVVSGGLKITEPAMRGDALAVFVEDGQAVCQTARQMTMDYEGAAYRPEATESDEEH